MKTSLLTFFLLLSFVPHTFSTDRAGGGDYIEPPFVAFGAAVLVDDGAVFVGRTGVSTLFQEPLSQTGGVHKFEKGDSGWTETREFQASDGAFGDEFGHSIARSGVILAVSAPRRGGMGTIYLFSESNSSDLEAGTLQPSGVVEGDSVGWGLAMAGDILVAGAPGVEMSTGSVFAYRQEGDHWVPLEPIRSPFGSKGRFGAAVAYDGVHLVIGAPGANDGHGAAVVYRMKGSSWSEVTRLSGGSDARGFGSAVDVEGSIVLIGAPWGSGAAYAVNLGASGETLELGPPVGQTSGALGISVALSGGDAWVGASKTGTSGTVYRYPSIGAAAPSAPLIVIPYPLPSGAGYGGVIDVDGDVAAMGVTNVDFASGRAYIFERDASSGAWKEAEVVTNVGFELAAVTGGKRKCEEGKIEMFSCENVELLSFLPVGSIGGRQGVTAADIWGWTDPDTDREYALANRSDGTAFVDITDPVNPIYVGDLPMTPGSVPNIWRDVKTYKNYALIVADNVGQHGMQIFDLTTLRDVPNPPATFTPTALYMGIHSAHNVIVNEETGFAYIVGADGGGNTCGGELHMVDIRDPLNPTFAGCFNDESIGKGTHDSQCVVYHGPDSRFAGHEICLSSNAVALSIADVTDKESPVRLSSASYPSVGYAHQGWLTDDHRYFYQDDEGDELTTDFGGTRTIVWDVSELDDPVLVTEFINQNKASDHNLYVKGDLMYQSNYVGGLRIIDISDRSNPKEVGHLDTMPFGDDAPGFAGSWSNYPFFKSGSIIVSSIREGLFVVKKADEVVP